MQVLWLLVFIFAFSMVNSVLVDSDKEDEFIFGIITSKCYDVLVTRRQFQNIPCLKLVLSKSLGFAIVGGSFALKLPQIIKIVNAKDVTGLTPTAFYLDVLMFQANSVYNYVLQYPISTWGENIIILFQNIFLVLLLWKYSKPPVSMVMRMLYAIMFVGIGAGMYNLPKEYRWLMASASIPMTCVARIPQVLENYQHKHTGQLALITLLLNVAGSLARLFTTIQETGDLYNLIGIAVSAVLNILLVMQIFMYWKHTNMILKRVKQE